MAIFTGCDRPVSRFCERHFKSKGTALTEFALHIQPTIHEFNNLLTNGETETCALRLFLRAANLFKG